jgi:predicted permease
LLTGVAFGLAPGLEVADCKLGETLQEEGRGSEGGMRTWLRSALVIVEIAFSLVLLVGAGLMVKSLSALMVRNPGFDTRGLLSFSVNLPPESYKDSAIPRFDHDFRDSIGAMPGVKGVVYTSVIPLTGGGNTIRFVIEGHPAPAGQENECSIRDISANYFSMMGIALVAGRVFNDTDDTASGPKHVIVNQSWVKRNLSPGENAIGKQVKFTYSPTQPYREIVGVVADIAEASLDASKDPILFTPYAQSPNSFLTYLVRAEGPPATAVGPVRAALQKIDPQLVLIQPTTMDQIITQSPSVFLRRYPSILIGSFSVLALILGMVGLYGLMSYSVSQRKRELGVRIALGAQASDVIRLVVWEGARLTLIGVGVGLAAALGLAQLMGSLLFGVSPVDPQTLVVVTVVLGLVALAACYIPARRATRTDPIQALRFG